MVQVLGNATTGTVYNDGGQVDLPRDTSTIRAAHQPWCVDCKRKGRELDVDQRCPQCARAAVTRAEGAARRAAAEEVAAAAAKADTATKPPKEGKQGKPTTRSSAPRATQTSDVPAQQDQGRTPGRAPGAGSSTHRERNPPAVQETRPETVGGPAPTAPEIPAPSAGQVLDAQVEHAAALLRRTAAASDPIVRAARAAVVAALESLHLAAELARPRQASGAQAPAPRSPRPASQKPPARRGHRGSEVDEVAVVREYQAGDTAPTIADRHGIGPNRVRRILERHGVERRDDRATANGGHNRITPAPELVAELVRRYVDEGSTISDLAEAHQVHRRVMTRILVDAGVTIRPAAHLRGTDLTPDQVTELIAAYTGGVSCADVAARFQVRTTTVKLLLAEAGVEIRRVKGASAQIAERLQDLGVTAKEVKEWALTERLIEHANPGLVATALIDAYAAAHRKDPAA